MPGNRCGLTGRFYMDNNKKALITGATKGMGRAIAVKLAALNFDLFLCSRNLQELEDLKTQLRQQFTSVRIEVSAVDFSDNDELYTLPDIVKDQPIDVLINNVGMFRPDSILESDPETLHTHMQVNFFTPRYLSAHFGRKMKERKQGHIINISSVASREPVVAAGSYTVTKYALSGLTKVLREQLKSHGVKVTEIIPGSTYTSSWEGTEISVDKFVRAEDIAEAVAFAITCSAGANVDEIRITPVEEVG